MSILLLASVFTTAVQVTGGQRFLLMLPLCLSVAIVYKTTRCVSLRDVAVSALVLWVTIVSAGSIQREKSSGRFR